MLQLSFTKLWFLPSRAVDLNLIEHSNRTVFDYSTSFKVFSNLFFFERQLVLINCWCYICYINYHLFSLIYQVFKDDHRQQRVFAECHPGQLATEAYFHWKIIFRIVLNFLKTLIFCTHIFTWKCWGHSTEILQVVSIRIFLVCFF